MNILHKIKYLPILILAALSFGSCDKLDDNGPFEGYWVLLDYEGYEGNKVGDISSETTIPDGGHLVTDFPTNTHQTIIWCVRNSLIEMRSLSTTDFYFMRFTRTDKELVITEVFYNDGSNDKAIQRSDIPEIFCIPADGHFAILQLDAKGMILQGEAATLTFKKN